MTEHHGKIFINQMKNKIDLLIYYSYKLLVIAHCAINNNLPRYKPVGLPTRVSKFLTDIIHPLVWEEALTTYITVL